MSTSRAACDVPGVYARLLFLSGIVAVAWLAGGIGVAFGETASESGGLADRVMGVDDTAERMDRASGGDLREATLSETAAHATTTTETLADTVAPQAASLPANALDEVGVAAALDETAAGAATHKVVDDTARGAGDLVAGVTRTGQGVVESTDGSLRDTGLVDRVAEGLTGSTRAVGDGLDRAVNTAAPIDLSALGAAGASANEPAGSSDRRSTSERRGATAPRTVRTGIDPGANTPESVWRAVSEEAAERSAAADDTNERIRLIGGGAHHPVGTDSTGTTASSFPAPGAAGFLMARATHTEPQAQRIALPGDPTLVVRDAADDPTFSPD